MAEPVDVGAVFVGALTGAGLYAVQLDGMTVPLLALAPELLAGVERACGVPWVQLIESPTADLTGALMLVSAAAQHAGLEQPEPATVGELVALFVRLPARDGGDA